jgi:Formamidopyrimidine-DNA glycosylase
MPSMPISTLIDRDVKVIVGKTISAVKSEKIYNGEYDWHADSFVRLNELTGTEITYADSHCITISNGLRVEFAYNHGDWIYSDNGTLPNFSKLKKVVSDAHIVTITFSDNSAMYMRLYSWSTHFRIANSGENYSIISLDKFLKWLDEHDNMNIIENCSTVKGVFDIYNPVMCWILLQCRINPRTKTRNLLIADRENIYNMTIQLINDYMTGVRTCEYINFSGENVKADNDVVWLTSAMKGKPCPICGMPIDSTPCAGTKMYYCPDCQTLIKKNTAEL